MKQLPIKCISILEWYDAPLIALVRGGARVFYVVCADYDFSRRKRSYLAVEIDAIEESLLSRIFECGEPGPPLEQFWIDRADRGLLGFDSSFSNDGTLNISPKSETVSSRQGLFTFPVIDVLVGD